jgi:enoyl-CoA hydratase/carnithine racemase
VTGAPARYGPLRVEREPGLVLATIDHPPDHLVDGPLIAGLAGLLDEADADPELRVLVLRSADPDFFLMHGDVVQLAAITPGERAPVTRPNAAAAVFSRLSSGHWLSIGLIDGIARGGGCELLSSLDLRIGTPRTLIGQPEVALGILPGAGGSVRLPRLLGRGRALELLLTGRDIGAEEAAAIGWLDELVEPDRLEARGLGLARHIAAMPAASVAAVKAVVDVAMSDPVAALIAESAALARLLGSGAHRAPMRRFLAAGGQQREAEILRMRELLEQARAEDT